MFRPSFKKGETIFVEFNETISQEEILPSPLFQIPKIFPPIPKIPVYLMFPKAI